VARGAVKTGRAVAVALEEEEFLAHDACPKMAHDEERVNSAS
jgi:hypothetical protein